MKWQEVKPSFFFIARFLVFYLVCNFVYGWWITSYVPKPDPVTVAVTQHSTFILDLLGYEVNTIVHHSKPAQRILLDERPVLSVFEGCNGINVWIIFVAFTIAFSKFSRKVVIFILAGTAVIYLINQARIIFLFFISLAYPETLYFFHKYFFTAGIYLVVFAMWYYWIKVYDRRIKVAN
jgi:exosortase family protein XrtF